MGEIADTHRSALRQLAQASDRLYRGLAEGLSDSATTIEEPRALIQPEGGAPATEAQLLDLKNDALQELCAQRGIKVPKRPRKDLMVSLLLVDPNSPPPLSLLSPPPTKPTAGGKGTGARLAAPTYAALGAELGMTDSEAHGAVDRAVAAKLAIKDGAGKLAVVRAALRAFVLHGARYSFPATQGGLSRGVPTGYAASPLNEQIRPGKNPPPVWPWKKGTARGIAFHPLYPSVPEAAERNPALRELLALFDGCEAGSAREQALALTLLEERLLLAGRWLVGGLRPAECGLI